MFWSSRRSKPYKILLINSYAGNVHWQSDRDITTKKHSLLIPMWRVWNDTTDTVIPLTLQIIRWLLVGIYGHWVWFSKHHYFSFIFAVFDKRCNLMNLNTIIVTTRQPLHQTNLRQIFNNKNISSKWMDLAGWFMVILNVRMSPLN